MPEYAPPVALTPTDPAPENVELYALLSLLKRVIQVPEEGKPTFMLVSVLPLKFATITTVPGDWESNRSYTMSLFVSSAW